MLFVQIAYCLWYALNLFLLHVGGSDWLNQNHQHACVRNEMRTHKRCASLLGKLQVKIRTV